VTQPHTFAATLDPFDPLDEMEVDEHEGFKVVELSEGSEAWYRVHDEQNPLCLFGIGDEDGLCIRERYGCHIEGCEFASRN